MSVIGTLTAVISANTAPFEQGMKRSQTAMGNLSSGAAAAGPSIMEMGTKLLGVASAAALAWKGVSIFNSSFSHMDQLGDTADNLGVNVERLQELHYAAMQAGGSAEKMDTSLQKMQRNVVDAATGTGAATDVLKELGVNAQDLARMTPDVMFRTLSEAISKVENPAQRMQMSLVLFGRGAGDLRALIDGGAASLDAYTQAARDNGVVIGEGSVAAADAADKAWRSLTMQWEAMTANLVGAMLPALTAVVKWLTDHKGVAIALGIAIGALASVLVVYAASQMAAAAATAVMMAVAGNPLGLLALGAGVAVAAGAIAAFTATTAESTKASGEQAKKINGTTAALQGQAAAAEDAAKKLKAKQEADKKAGESIFESTRTAEEKFAKKEADLRRLLGVGAINRDTFERAMAQAQNELDKAQPKAKDPEPPKLARTADRARALSGSDAINQFLLNQNNTGGDPIERLLKQQHEEEIAKLEAIRTATERNSARVGVF